VGTPVYADRDGWIRNSYDDDGWGHYTEVHSDEKRSRGDYSLSAHLSKIVVKNGEYVRKGQLIGYVGTSGNPPEGGDPHLHFELRVGGRTVDPYEFYRFGPASPGYEQEE
jgi:murein DD-endopeptidase MepM/ murein hydrolase activator NlpD